MHWEQDIKLLKKSIEKNIHITAIRYSNFCQFFRIEQYNLVWLKYCCTMIIYFENELYN